MYEPAADDGHPVDHHLVDDPYVERYAEGEDGQHPRHGHHPAQLGLVYKVLRLALGPQDGGPLLRDRCHLRDERRVEVVRQDRHPLGLVHNRRDVDVGVDGYVRHPVAQHLPPLLEPADAEGHHDLLVHRGPLGHGVHPLAH